MTRFIVVSLAAAVLIPTLSLRAEMAAEEPAQEPPPNPILDHTMVNLDGNEVRLAERYGGKVLLIVNTASKCGHTPQYADLQTLHEKYADKGLAVLGFPCNQFGGQAPGDSLQIRQFCTENYGVTFDMFSKINVNGDEAAPLYQYLTSKETPLEDQGPVKWNFEKFLISREGELVARFRSKVKPTSEEVVEAIEEQLKVEGEAQ